ncbi:hypothetical protein SKAU_G00205040 [Synaphobranchus kaupii]|uniref:Cytochrome b-c1 complex subunit 10 n=1 Tax=Synaphobranchus kaupii TaxID=118154 RepID=A0A9Q1FGL3_SYNKA|nr:hypothetical protein SKAU_G00205040 [Synaphobranchus kaupii]
MLQKLVGPRYLTIAKTCHFAPLPLSLLHPSCFCFFIPFTMAVWGGIGGVALVHFTDWRLVLDYVPYINGKFNKDE